MAGQDNGHNSRARPSCGGITKAPALKGGRRLCGRIPGSAVVLCKRRCRDAREQHNQNQKRTPPRNKTEPRPHPEHQSRRNDPNPNPEETEPIGQRNTKKNKKTLGQKQKNTSPLWGENRENPPKTPEKRPGTEGPGRPSSARCTDLSAGAWPRNLRGKRNHRRDFVDPST